jgi:hypothetical protein
MWSLLAKLRPIRKVSMSRALSEALALQRRGEARPDGIFSFSFAVKLAVNWRARDLHPWDFDMPEERKAPRLVDQTLHDTEAAIARIFAAFPEVDTLELNVFEKAPDSNRMIIAGVVIRSDLGRCASTSIRMRLRMLGLNYRLKNQHFEPVATGRNEPQPVGQVMQDLVRGGSQDDPASAASIDTQSRPLWPDGDRHPN